MTGGDMELLPPRGPLVCHIPRFPTGLGTCSLRLVGVLGQEMSDDVQAAATFDVVAGDYYRSGNSPNEYKSFPVDHEWRLEIQSRRKQRPGPLPVRLIE
jgi:hypothetical protein